MIQEHRVEQYAQNLRQRRVFCAGSLVLMFQVFAAHPNRKNLLSAQSNDGTQRLLQSQATVAEERFTPRDLQTYGRKNQWDRGRSANVVDGDLGCHGYAPAAIPNRMALFALNEEVAHSRVVVSGRNSQCIQIPATDVS